MALSRVRTSWVLLLLVAALSAAAWLVFAPFLHRAQASESSREVSLGRVRPDSLYALTVSVKNPAEIQNSDSVHVLVSDALGVVSEKWLHAADLDFYLTLRPRAEGPAGMKWVAAAGTKLPRLTVSFTRIPLEAGPAAAHARESEPAVIAAHPNGTWQSAQEFEFGQTIFGSADERPYAPAPVEDAYAAMVKGFQWFRFTFHRTEPRLAFFVLDITDRDVPLDVDIFQSGKDAEGNPDVEPYKEGQFIYQIEATQNYPGLYKFRTRILRPGETYFVRIAADHPAYQLHTYDYPIPPYKDPRQAVRTGMDFLIDLGDTWLSNTPRRGAIALRTSMVHSEPQLCIACHPTQFTTRGYLTAVRNGYPPLQRPALEFLTDRIYNNARPLYGEPGSNWVRIIYSARVVSSRLPLIERLFEENVSHDPPRMSFNIPYGNFLKIHYKDRKEMPGNEVDGCEPDISPFEIAAQSWQTFDQLYRETSDPQWRNERDTVERLAVPYKPENMIDLNWKIHFLATLGRDKYANELNQLIEKLYLYQRPDGMWPYPFDKSAKPSDFISYHSVLALALAGHRPETDPKMARAVEAMLAAQRPEGSWEGDPVYQGFNTPFRATQFAVMALSTLYPGPAKSKNWGAGFLPPPTRLATSDLPQLLYQLDQFWDLAPEPALAEIRSVLEGSSQPLAREAAARALGHMADPGAVNALVNALGDPSKMVQRTAAWALRQVLVRRPAVSAEGHARLVAALRSPDARTRWGATRLFNQHFKYLTDDREILRALMDDLSDSVPMIRFHAAKALWQWYYWQVDHRETRRGILEALATRFNTETNPIVRRGLHESVYNVLDENTGYLGSWVRTASTKDDQNRIIEGYEAVVRDLTQILAQALRTATPLGREGLLASLWDFHVRHMALPPLKENTVSIALPAVFVNYVSGVPDLHRPGYVYPPYRETVDFKYNVHNGFYQTRVGNDSDLIHFFQNSGPELEDSLIACLKGANDDTKINVLKAGSTLSAAGDARFALAALRLSLDPDEEVRKTVQYVYENGQRGILNIDASSAPDPDLVKTVVTILKRGSPESQAVVLPLLASLPKGDRWTAQPEVVEAVRALLERQPRPKNYAEVLDAASSFEELTKEPSLRDRILAGLTDTDPNVQRAAMDVVLERFLSSSQTLPLVESALLRLGSSQRATLIEEVSDPKFMRRHLGTAGGAVSQDNHYFLDTEEIKPPNFLEQPVVLKAVIASVRDAEANVRAAALDLLRRVKDIENQPDFRAALQTLQNDPNPRLQLVAANVLGGKTLRDALKDVKPGSLLDFDFFVTRVEPILAQPGSDGKACVMCHATHAIFKLQPPNELGVFTQQISEENYKYALRVVDISNPEHSLILVKPTHPSESGGNVNDYYATHNGGQRWKGNEASWEYKTILQWVRGARPESAKK